MAIVFNCPNCGNSISAPESGAGKRGKCPGCGEAILVPAADVPPEEEVYDADVVDDPPESDNYSVTPSRANRPRDDDDDDDTYRPRLRSERNEYADDEKQCSACGEMIKAVARRCRFCGEEFFGPGSTERKPRRRRRRKSSRTSTTSDEGSGALVMGIAAVILVFCCWPLGAVLGFQAISKADEAGGEGTAVAGKVLGYIAVGLSLLGLLGTLAHCAGAGVQ